MKITREEQLKALENLPDDKIDLTDIPEIKDFSNFEIGKYYRPIKKSVTLRIDSDILEWFKQNNPKYQTAINEALRRYIHLQ